MRKQKTEVIQMRVTPAVKRAIEEIAEEHHTSVARVVEYSLQQQFPEIAKLLNTL